MYRVDYQSRRLGEGGGLRQMLVCDVSGVEWGMFTLMGGVEKPQRFTGQFHYIFFVVCGLAYLTLGDAYNVPYTEAPMAPGFCAEVQRGNYYSIRNADAKAPVTFMFYKTPGPAEAT
jgi:hypothetical protein